MLLSVRFLSDKEVILEFSNREPFKLRDSDGNVADLLDEFLAPLSSECKTLSEYKDMCNFCEEDTAVIDLEEIA